MTFAHYEFDRGARIHEHFHPEEEVYEVLEGALELSIDGVSPRRAAGFGCHRAARHSVRAITNGRVIVVDHPARRAFG